MNADIESLVAKVRSHLELGTQGTGFGGQVGSLESWDDPTTASAMRNQLSANQAVIDAMTDGLGLGVESFGGGYHADTSKGSDWIAENQKKQMKLSAALMLEAATDPVAFARSAKASQEAFEARHASKNWDYVADYTNGERAQALGIVDNQTALESFENNNLSAAMDYSVAFNFLAPVQEPGIEMLFKTIVMGQDQVAFFYETSIDRYYNGHKHILKDKRTGQLIPARREFEKNNLIDTIRHPELLRHDVLRVVPFYDTEEAEDAETGEEYKALFMQTDDNFEFDEYKLVNTSVPTRPLVVGKEYNLLQISAHPDLMNGGIFDETDTIDSHLAIDKIYVQFGDAANSTDIVEFPLLGLERRNFIKSVQGHGYEMDLKFRGTEFIIDGNTKNMKGEKLATFQGMIDANYRARLAIEIVGTANIETSYLTVQHASVKLDTLYQVSEVDGSKVVTKVDVTSKDPAVVATLANIKEHLDKINSAKLKWFTPYANRTNRNYRSFGLMVDSDVFTAKFAIGVREPIRLQRPVGSDRNYPTVEKLLNVMRAKQTADAFYELFSYRDTLRTYVTADTYDETRTPDFLGLGKSFIKPFYEYLQVDVTKFIKSGETRNNLENVREGLVGILQEAAARMIMQTQWSIAATMLNAGKQVKPHLGILTGQYLPLLLSVKGDLRLLGQNFDHTLRDSMNAEMDNKIIMVPLFTDAEGFHPLNFGYTFYYPELLTTLSPHLQNGATKDTVMLSPRYQHVANLPAMVEVDVIGIKEFMREYNQYRVEITKQP